MVNKGQPKFQLLDIVVDGCLIVPKHSMATLVLDQTYWACMVDTFISLAATLMALLLHYTF